MLRNATVVLAIVLVLGSSGLSTSAFARGGAYGGGGGGDSFRGDHFGGSWVCHYSGNSYSRLQATTPAAHRGGFSTVTAMVGRWAPIMGP